MQTSIDRDLSLTKDELSLIDGYLREQYRGVFDEQMIQAHLNEYVESTFAGNLAAIIAIEKAERDGSLKPGGTIVEGTSGNTGVALAIAAALRGYKCIFTMPDKMSQEKVRLLKAYGAEVVITPTAVPPDHPDSYVMTAKRIAHETPNAILANQFYNQANPDAHHATTGPELWEQTKGRITHLIAGAGTGGTITGAGRYLKERSEEHTS